MGPFQQWIHHHVQHKFLARLPKGFPLATPYSSFLRDGGNELLFAPSDFRDTDLFVDFGAFKGESMYRVLNESRAQVLGFEPVQDFYEELNNLIGANERARIHNCLIGSTDGSGSLKLEDDRSGAWADGIDTEIEIRRPEQFLSSIGDVKAIAMINIEGGEYELIPLLHDSGILEKFDCLFIQFHRIKSKDESARQLQKCYTILQHSHERKWGYDFVWERWDKRKEKSLT